MFTVEQRLRHVTLKVSRAKEHLGGLERQVAAYLAAAPYKVATKRDAETFRLTYYVDAAASVPDSIALLAGDTIQNLMSALDHLAYQLVCCDTGDQPPNPNWVYFPIADDAATYHAKKHGKMAGARQETFAAIDALAPYKGGNDPLWTLYRLNNIEKHRLLLTVGSQAAGIHLGQMMAPLLRSSFSADAVAAFESMDLFLNPADKGFPLQPGFELYITAPDEQPNPKLQFRFTVALDEPGIVEGKPLLEALNELVAAVESTVGTLTPRLR